MNSPSSQPPPESLLAEIGWVRHLAASLVRDRDQAEDLAQDALLAAWEKPPPRGGNLRGWLAQVLRHRASNQRRGQYRRALRERAHASTGHHDEAARVPGPQQLIERASLHEAVVHAVLSLEEPYRSTLLLRFFEEMSPNRIATEWGIPAATVRTRLKRGLEQLRGKLEQHYEPDDLLAALIGLATPPLGSLPPTGAGPSAVPTLGTMGTLMMMGKQHWAAITALLAISGLAIGVATFPNSPLEESLEEQAETGIEARMATSANEPQPVPSRTETATVDGRARLATPQPTATKDASIPESAARMTELVVRVLRAEDEVPMSEIPVQVTLGFSSSSLILEGSTDEQGEWRGEAPIGQVVHLVDVRATTTSAPASRLLNIALKDEGLAPIVVRIPAPVRVTGRVIDEQGFPVPHAKVLGVLGAHSGLASGQRPAWEIDADAEGQFEIGNLSEAFTLEARTESHAAWNRASATLGAGQVFDGVELIVAPAHVLTGRILTETEHPVAKASVMGHTRGFGRLSGKKPTVPIQYLPPIYATHQTDEEGRYRFERVVGRPWKLRVVARGFDTFEQGIEPHMRELDIRLPSSSQVTIQGRVVDEVGRGIAGAAVWANRYFSTTTNDSGEFSVHSKPREEPTRIIARAPGFAIASRELALVPSTPKVELRLARERTLSGTVLDRDGQPVAFANLDLWSERAAQPDVPLNPINSRNRLERLYQHWQFHTNRAGEFHIPNLERIAYNLSVTTDSASTPEALVRIGANEQHRDIRLGEGLEKWVTLRGTVRDAVTNRALTEGLSLYVRGEKKQYGTMSAHLVSGQEEFELNLVQGGRLQLYVAAEGYVAAHEDLGFMTSGVRELHLQLFPERSLRARFLDPDGHPLPEVPVWIHELTGEPFPLDRRVASNQGQPQSNELGELDLARLPAKPLQLIAWPNDPSRKQSLRIDLTKASHVRIDFTLDPDSNP